MGFSTSWNYNKRVFGGPDEIELKGGYENGLRYVAGGKYDLFAVQTLSPQEIEDLDVAAPDPAW